MRQQLPLFAACLVWASVGLTRGYQWPSPQYDALESFLWEGGDTRVGSPIAILVTDCARRGDPPGSIGAQWLRFVSAFSAHDVHVGIVADAPPLGGLGVS